MDAKTEWTPAERMDMHLEAIYAVQAEMKEAALKGDMIAYRDAGERLAVLEHCTVGEAKLQSKKIA